VEPHKATIAKKDHGGYFDLVPDERGSVEMLGPGLYRELKTSSLFTTYERDPNAVGRVAVGNVAVRRISHAVAKSVVQPTGPTLGRRRSRRRCPAFRTRVVEKVAAMETEQPGNYEDTAGGSTEVLELWVILGMESFDRGGTDHGHEQLRSNEQVLKNWSGVRDLLHNNLELQ